MTLLSVPSRLRCPDRVANPIRGEKGTDHEAASHFGTKLA
jgi:hypothetical protein